MTERPGPKTWWDYIIERAAVAGVFTLVLIAIGSLVAALGSVTGAPIAPNSVGFVALTGGLLVFSALLCVRWDLRDYEAYQKSAREER